LRTGDTYFGKWYTWR